MAFIDRYYGQKGDLSLAWGGTSEGAPNLGSCRQEKHEREKAEGGDPHVGQYEGCFQVVFSGWEGTSDGAPNLGS